MRSLRGLVRNKGTNDRDFLTLMATTRGWPSRTVIPQPGGCKATLERGAFLQHAALWMCCRCDMRAGCGGSCWQLSPPLVNLFGVLLLGEVQMGNKEKSLRYEAVECWNRLLARRVMPCAWQPGSEGPFPAELLHPEILQSQCVCSEHGR